MAKMRDLVKDIRAAMTSKAKPDKETVSRLAKSYQGECAGIGEKASACRQLLQANQRDQALALAKQAPDLRERYAPRWLATALLGEDPGLVEPLMALEGGDRLVATRDRLLESLRSALGEQADTAIAAARFQAANTIARAATVGSNGLAQGREFTKAGGVSGLVLTKLDGTARGGVAVAVVRDLGVPIRYVGVGETLEDLLPFDAGDFAASLVGEE